MAKVLIVEDNPANMSLAIFLLQSAGHTVLSAVDAEIGLRLARDEQPNLILMDIQLPGMDGLEATVLLKRDAATRAIPVIALTALAMKSDEERIRAAGCDGYIAKPLEYRNFWRPFQLNWSPRGCKARVTGAKMNPSVGVQWELRRAVARRDQSHALGFFLNPAPLTGTLPRRRFRFAESPFSLKDPRVDGSKRRGQGLPGVGDGKAAGEPSRPKCRRMRGFPPFSPPARLVATREPVRGTVKWLGGRESLSARRRSIGDDGGGHDGDEDAAARNGGINGFRPGARMHGDVRVLCRAGREGVHSDDRPGDQTRCHVP